MTPAPPDVLRPATGPRRILEVVPPEGVVLPFQIASAGERLAAYLVDLACQGVVLLILLALFAWATVHGSESHSGSWLGAVWLLALFVVLNGYFLWFELGPRCATPGKRWFGLRVMDARGAVLTPGAVAARNLMRNLELHVPLFLLLQPGALGAGTSGWMRLLLVVWPFVLAGLPLFNRLRLRPGDLVGGTVVVVAPRPVLLGELTRATPARAAEGFGFTPAQLGVYGVYELQVLEDLLRRADEGLEPGAHLAVASKIKKKIHWEGELDRRAARRFLLDFYAALRRHLEERLLLGKRKEDKRSKER